MSIRIKFTNKYSVYKITELSVDFEILSYIKSYMIIKILNFKQSIILQINLRVMFTDGDIVMWCKKSKRVQSPYTFTYSNNSNKKISK